MTSRTAALGAAIVLLAAAGVTAWPAAAKDACGTAWASKVEPPESILVHRTASGDVEEVGLKHYVAVVMASGEWPSSLPPARVTQAAREVTSSWASATATATPARAAAAQ